MNTLSTLTVGAALGSVLTLVGTQKESTYVDLTYGFELELPDLDSGPDQQIAHFFGAPDEAGTPNMNVITQEFEGTMEEYLEISKAGLDGSSLKLVTSRVFEHDGNPAIEMEYVGDAFGPELHFLAFGVLRGTEVILLTGTSSEAAWDSFSSEFESSFESLSFSTSR